VRLRLVSLVALTCCLGCESLFIVPTNEDVASWGEHRTFAGDRTIVYKLPPNPEVLVYPRRVAELAPTSRTTQAFAIVNYGYGLPEPRVAELGVLMEVRLIDGGGMQATWTAEEFARFYWARTQACHEMLSPFNPKFEKLVESQLVDLGDTTWYELTYPDIGRSNRISGDAFMRPISPTHVLSVYALYWDYPFMSPEAIERRRALMRKIVAQVRVEPPFGPPP
jgi:hypothetical protein